jgi:hypothetical protein
MIHFNVCWSVLDAFHGWLYQRWHNLSSDPRVAGSDTVVHAAYESWFAAVPFDDFDCARPQSFCPAYVHDTASFHKSHLASLLRFRLGAHSLRISTGRWEQAGRASLPRQHRVCCRCTSGTVEDEFHMVFECHAYEPIRERFWRLFVDFGDWDCPTAAPGGRDLARFMQQSQWLLSYTTVSWYAMLLLI